MTDRSNFLKFDAAEVIRNRRQIDRSRVKLSFRLYDREKWEMGVADLLQKIEFVVKDSRATGELILLSAIVHDKLQITKFNNVCVIE